MAADDSEGMTHQLLVVLRSLQNARLCQDVSEALRAASRLYGLKTGPNDDSDHPTHSVEPDGASKDTVQFLVSYLPPMGDIPEALLQWVYNREDVQSASDILTMADGFFLEVHPIFSIGSLASYLSRSNRGEAAERHVWRLLKIILVDRSEVWKLWDSVMWTKAYPERKWEDICNSIVGWLIIIVETEGTGKPNDFDAQCCLSDWVSLLLDGVLSMDMALTEKMVVLFGMCLRRFLNRGSGQVIVDVLINQCRLKFDHLEAYAVLVDVLEHIHDPHALETFFVCALTSLRHDPLDAVSVLHALYPKSEGRFRDTVAYILFHRILTKRPLSKQTVEWIIHLLIESKEKLVDVIRQLAQTWSNADAIHHMSIPDQAYRTYLLTQTIPHLSDDLEGDDRILRFLLNGVSNRLENPLEIIRFQGMRVAHIIAAQQPNADPLFHDMDTDFQKIHPEEQWDPSEDVTSPTEASDKTANPTDRVVDSDDDSDASSIEEQDLEPLVKEEAPETVIMKGHRPMTLMDVHRDLHDAEEPMKIIAALKHLPVFLKEHPPELLSMAAALSRTLVHVALPDWISEEMLKDDAGELKGLKSSTDVRVHCLTRLLIEAPMQCGGHVAAMVASKQLAEYQRLEILEALRQAALGLSHPPTPQLAPQPSEDTTPDASRLHDAKTRVWGIRSLDRNRKTGRTWRNRFVDVVGLWLSLLLACQSKQQKFNIIERNPVVMGGVLITLGTFADCSAHSIASTSVALTSFPLIQAIMKNHPSSVHLRRCVFRSLASIIGSIPIGRLSSVIGCPLTMKTDRTDEALRDMLAWIKERTEAAMTSDSDECCRGLAAHTLQLYCQISQSALEQSKPSLSPFPYQRSIEFRIPSLDFSNFLK